MRRFAIVLALAACDPPATTPTPAAATTGAGATEPAQNIDVRVDFEQGSDAYSSTISAFLTVPAMNVHAQLFSVPFPYQCMRSGEADGGDALVVECRGDDGSAFASVHVENGHVVAIAHDYGRITADKTVKDLALPPHATATIYAPPKYPSAH